MKVDASVRLTVVGDLHAKPDNLDKVETLFRIVEALGHNTVWLGDLLDTKELVRSRCLNRLYQGFKGSKLTHYILVGNHDWHNLDCTDHSLQLLKELRNVVVVDEPFFKRFLVSSQVQSVAFMPYYHDLGKFRSDLVKVKLEKPKVIFMHQGFTGFEYGNGRIAENEVDPNEVSDLPLIISGHFHKKQLGGNLVYPGTPFSQDFGESNQEKFVGILTLEEGVTPTAQSLELFPTDFPRHLTIELDADRIDEAAYAQLRAELAPEDRIRFVLTGTQEGVNLFRREAFPGAKFIEKPILLQSDITIDETETNDAKFVRWATEIGKLDGETAKLGLHILEEVRK